MKPPDPKWRAWVSKAEHDLRAIRAIRQDVSGEEPPWDVVCFHAQQAAEKMLKAFLACHQQQPPKTHDLTALLGLCRVLDATLDSLGDDCSLLTDFAVECRYPADLDEPQKEEAAAAVAAAERVRNAVLQRLPEGKQDLRPEKTT
jgi:HEPN domain-containing protein